MRYRGQSFELEVAVAAQLDEDVIARFHQATANATATPIRIAWSRLSACGCVALAASRNPRLKARGRVRRYQPKPERTAFVWLGERRKQIPVYDREELRPGAAIKGPAIIVEYGSTTLAPAGWKVKVDGWKNLVLDEQTRSVQRRS